MSDIQLEEQEQIAQRRSKLQDWREKGLAFPTSFRRTVIASELYAAYEASSKEALDEHLIRVKVAGRIMTRRILSTSNALITIPARCYLVGTFVTTTPKYSF